MGTYTAFNKNNSNIFDSQKLSFSDLPMILKKKFQFPLKTDRLVDHLLEPTLFHIIIVQATQVPKPFH